MSEAFSGFQPEAIDFLWQLRFNNNRDWFSAHKQTYLTHFYQPMRELEEELYGWFTEQRPKLPRQSNSTPEFSDI